MREREIGERGGRGGGERMHATKLIQHHISFSRSRSVKIRRRNALQFQITTPSLRWKNLRARLYIQRFGPSVLLLCDCNRAAIYRFFFLFSNSGLILSKFYPGKYNLFCRVKIYIGSLYRYLYSRQVRDTLIRRFFFVGTAWFDNKCARYFFIFLD